MDKWHNRYIPREKKISRMLVYALIVNFEYGVVITYLSDKFFFPFGLSAFSLSAFLFLLCFCCDSLALDSWHLCMFVALAVETGGLGSDFDFDFLAEGMVVVVVIY